MENLTNDSVIPIIREKDFEMESFVMGFHNYKNASIPVKNEKLETCMEPENKEDKFAVTVIGGKSCYANQLTGFHMMGTLVIKGFMKGNTGIFAKIIFYFLSIS